MSLKTHIYFKTARIYRVAWFVLCPFLKGGCGQYDIFLLCVFISYTCYSLYPTLTSSFKRKIILVFCIGVINYPFREQVTSHVR